MPGITDPGQEYFKDGVWAWVTDQWKKLVADASSFLQINIAAQDIDVEVKQTTAADLTPGACGWDGSAWHKLPMVWGFTETVADRGFDVDAAAGVNDLTFEAPPVGEVWVITNVAFRNRNTVCSSIVVTALVAGASPPLVAEYSPVAMEWDTCVIHCILEYGDSLMVRFNGCVALDYIETQMIGYSMSVAE